MRHLASAVCLERLEGRCLLAAVVTDGYLEGDIRLAGGSPVMAKEGGTYYVFTGGDGYKIRTSTDTVHWTQAGSVFTGVPQWAKDEISDANLWAPDIAYRDGKWWLYYCVSSLGSRNSAIGVASNITLDASDPNYQWVDHGMVIRSDPSKNWNAIDPNLIIDKQGRPWMVFGSYWSGIKMRRIDPATGKLSSADTTLYALATRTGGTNAVEAPFIVRRGDYFYLFVSWDRQPTDYNIRVGRSTSITGPYLDRDGVDMMEGGGTLVLKGYDHIVAPGHNGVLMNDDGTDWMVFHYKDDNTENQRRTLQVREIVWDPQGWPAVGEPHRRAFLTPLDKPVTAGRWLHAAGFGSRVPHRLLSNGHIDEPDSANTWSQDGDVLTLRWPSASAPGGAFVDTVVLDDDGHWYAGRNQNGTVIRSLREFTDTTPPRVVTARFDPYAPRMRLQFTFVEGIAEWSLGGDDLQLTNLKTNEPVAAGDVAVTYDAATRTANFTFPGYINGMLPDADYRAVLPAGAVEGGEGNPSDAPHRIDFSFLAGDANLDGFISGDDYTAIDFGIAMPGASGYANGDFNYDGIISGDDYTVIDFNRAAQHQASAFSAAAPAPRPARMADDEEIIDEEDEFDLLLPRRDTGGTWWW